MQRLSGAELSGLTQIYEIGFTFLRLEIGRLSRFRTEAA
jgi:hypothetical protein